MFFQIAEKLSLLKIATVQCLDNTSKKRDEVDFLYAEKHESFLQVHFNTMGVKVSLKVILSLLMGTQSTIFAIYFEISKVYINVSRKFILYVSNVINELTRICFYRCYSVHSQ